MPNLTVLKIFLHVSRNRLEYKPSFHIAVCKAKAQPNWKDWAQKRETLKTVYAADIVEARRFAEKWFGVTEEMWK